MDKAEVIMEKLSSSALDRKIMSIISKSYGSEAKAVAGLERLGVTQGLARARVLKMQGGRKLHKVLDKDPARAYTQLAAIKHMGKVVKRDAKSPGYAMKRLGEDVLGEMRIDNVMNRMNRRVRIPE